MLDLAFRCESRGKVGKIVNTYCSSSWQHRSSNLFISVDGYTKGVVLSFTIIQFECEIILQFEILAPGVPCCYLELV